MKTNYQKALEALEEARFTDGPETMDYLLRTAAIYANLAVADALRERALA